MWESVPLFRKLRVRYNTAGDRPLPERWSARPRLRRGSPVWRYLAEERGLPYGVLAAADAADIVREGPYGSAWFAHRDESGCVTHIEIRGPGFKGSVRGGTKTLFLLPGGSRTARLAVAEAPIDALSLAALEGIRADTLYGATGGGMGPATEMAIARVLNAMASCSGGILASATDANAAGERYAARHAEIAAGACVAFERMRPIGGVDWNDVIKRRRAA